MKRKLLLLSVMVICIAIAAAGTLAFFNGNATAHNVITTGKVAITLHEKDADGNKFEDKTGVMPGMSIDKIVTVENTGTAPAWVRVKLTPTITLDANNPQAKNVTPDTSLVKLETGDADVWEYNQTDGYYYYTKKLEAGKTTNPVLTKVTFDVTMGNAYQGATATVDVEAQAVQCANNGTSALTASGWPAADSGTTTPTTPDPAPTNPGEGGLDTGKTG